MPGQLPPRRLARVAQRNVDILVVIARNHDLRARNLMSTDAKLAAFSMMVMRPRGDWTPVTSVTSFKRRPADRDSAYECGISRT